jgi:hypothetical protein
VLDRTANVSDPIDLGELIVTRENFVDSVSNVQLREHLAFAQRLLPLVLEAGSVVNQELVPHGGGPYRPA